MQVLYTGREPDLTKAIEVLAFLLVPTSAFCEASDDIETRNAVAETIDNAKRNVLLRWYAQRPR